MEIQNKELHRITSTTIIYKGGKYRTFASEMAEKILKGN